MRPQAPRRGASWIWPFVISLSIAAPIILLGTGIITAPASLHPDPRHGWHSSLPSDSAFKDSFSARVRTRVSEAGIPSTLSAPTHTVDTSTSGEILARADDVLAAASAAIQASSRSSGEAAPVLDVSTVRPSPVVLLNDTAATVEPSGAAGGDQLENLTPWVPTYPDPFILVNGQAPDCHPPPVVAGIAKKLHLVAPEDGLFPVNCVGHEPLCEVLSRVAINREVMVAVANSAAPGLQGFLDSIKRIGIPNFMVVALDESLATKMQAQGVPYYFRPNSAQGNHKVSAQKFGILKEFVGVGCSVLLTDTDVVYMRDPFPYIHRDTDIEGMTDGWDNDTAHGFLDEVDDPLVGEASAFRHGASLRISALNSGLWYVRATYASSRLMTIMEHRMATEDLWDQSGYNLELFLPSHDGHLTAGCSVRVMSPLCFLNSKVLFRIIRFNPVLKSDLAPVACHVNYHTDKPAKMVLVADYYLNGDKGALDRCPTNAHGCQPDPVSAAALESSSLHSVNDGYVTSRIWMPEARRAALEQRCVPLPPWEGRLPGLDHELRFVDGVGQSTLAAAGAGLQGWCVRRLAALLGPSSPATASSVALCVMAGSVAMPARRTAASPASTKGVVLSELILVVPGHLEGETAALAQLWQSAHTLGVAGSVLVVAPRGWEGEAEIRALGANVVEVPEGLVGAAGSRMAPPPDVQKWVVARLLLALGHNVLLADAGTVFLRDPWQYLYRDSEVEVMSDGWDDQSAYGYDHVVDDELMGWSRYAHGTRQSSRDPGFAYLQATHEVVRLATHVARALMQHYSDNGAGAAAQQQKGEERRLASPERLVFNKELFLPSHGAYVGIGLSVRVLNYFCFPNSKTLLRLMRSSNEFAPSNTRGFVPVAVRASYTPNGARAQLAASAVDAYIRRNTEALKLLPLREQAGPELSLLCGAESHRMASDKVAPSALATTVTSGSWSWSGMTGLVFERDGALTTPWGKGEWGLVAGQREVLFAEFAGSRHMLTFQPGGGRPRGMFISQRCSDGEIVVGRAMAVA